MTIVADDGKAFKTLEARAACHGVSVWRSDGSDGPIRFFVSWRGLVQVLADLPALAAWIERFTGAKREG